MQWLALEAGDAATWGSTVVTFGMACFALVQGVGQKRDLRRQNELQSEASQLQRRQIETAERRTLVMEQLLAQLTAAARPTPPPPPEWQAEPHAWRHRPPARAAAPEPRPASDPEEDVSWGHVAARGSVPAAGPPWSYGTSAPPPTQDEPAPEDADEFEPAAVFAGSEPERGAAPLYDEPPPQDPAPWPEGQQTPLPFGAGSAGPQWRLEHLGRHGYALRNLGATTLTGVRVDPAHLPGIVRGVPENAVVRPGEAVEFLMAGSWGRPLPRSVLVSWDGQFTALPVQVPGS